MALRTDLPRIKPKDKPSYFNREMVENAFLANFFITDFFVWPEMTSVGRRVMLGLTAIGAAYGGIRGKRRMEEEQHYGKLVEDPSYINSGVGLGLLAGVTGMVAAKEIETKSFRFGGGGALAIAGLGAVVGSIFGRRHMVEEFNQAVALQKQMEKAPLQPALNTAQSTSHTAIQIQAATADDQGTLAPVKTQQIAN